MIKLSKTFTAFFITFSILFLIVFIDLQNHAVLLLENDTEIQLKTETVKLVFFNFFVKFNQKDALFFPSCCKKKHRLSVSALFCFIKKNNYCCLWILGFRFVFFNSRKVWFSKISVPQNNSQFTGRNFVMHS